MKITFHGGAGSVTGANYLFEHEGVRFLVDCGLFQGSHYAETLNYDPFPYDVRTIDALILTHSHADHMGRVPKLYREGFRGKIYGTGPTVEITKIALPDNYNLIHEEARRDGHKPLFTPMDISNSFALFHTVNYETPIHVGKNVTVVLHNAGHILGSSIVEIQWMADGISKKMYCSGDLGNMPSPLLEPPYQPRDADYLMIESAYGNRLHEDVHARRSVLASIIVETVKSGGTVMIPSFAIERTQEILYEIHQLLESQLIPSIPVFVDSPMAISITSVYSQFPHYMNDEARSHLHEWGGLFQFPSLRLTRTVEESKKINFVKGPKVIIAGSGMSMGGRILHHEQRYLSDPRSAIVFVGYQVLGSLGRKILDGADTVTIFGQSVEVRCRREAIGGYSAHADQSMLASWVKGATESGKLKHVFIVQGERPVADDLASHLKTTLHVEAHMPDVNDSVELL